VHHYYFIDSNGEDTNLQLYSLKQAKLYWADLERDLAESEEVEHFHERCVFVICTMGLSVSQLLGQNNPQPNERVPPPSTIFNSLVGTTTAPTATGEAKLELGPMLEAAAAKECPRGFDLTQDKVPAVRTDSNRLIGTLRGVARCK
jgi:hypothetical protein